MQIQIKHVACLLLGLLGFKALPAQAVDMYLCIDGVQGEVKETDSKQHAGCIDVLAWSWGMSNSGTAAGAGKANFQDISVTKYLDRASPTLGLRVADGSPIGAVELFVEESCGDGCTAAHIYSLDIPSGSVVTSQSQGGSGGESRLTENISINMPAVQWCYSYYPDGVGGKSAPIKTCEGWNIQTNTPYNP